MAQGMTGLGTTKASARRTARAPEPRWPAALALLSVGGLYLALPESLTYGPNWLLLAAVFVLLVPTFITKRLGNLFWNQITGYIVVGVVTADLIVSLVLLVHSLPRHTLSPVALLGSAAALWGTNILVFAIWYWRLDAGGPNVRDTRGRHTKGDFLFPQMTIDPERCTALSVDQNWAPGFIDYLFLAFNTSTAFSPTDVPVLSRWAKVLMMLQSTISFTTVALLAARAVNIL
jgi:hypothetical protein